MDYGVLISLGSPIKVFFFNGTLQNNFVFIT